MRGLFMMNRLAGGTKLLVSRYRSPTDEVRLSGLAAGVSGLPWGQVSNGLQIAVMALSPAVVNTNDSSMRLGVAVRNVSNGPIVVNRMQAQGRLTLFFDGKEVAVREPPQPIAVVSNAEAAPPAVVVLQPNQICMLASKGNPDSGCLVSLPPGESWLVKATYRSAPAKKDDPPFWVGSLESGPLAVKAFMPLIRPPRMTRPAPGPVPGDGKTQPIHGAPVGVSQQPSRSAPESKPANSAKPQ
jgi:hypothetical protein